jgi:adenylosuccinate lyase
MMTAYENIPLWHERDISHSSAERIILADATTLIDYMLNRMTNIFEGLVVNEDKILENIELTHGVIFAQEALNQLIHSGMSREEAYDLIQKLSMQSLQSKIHFKALLETNEVIQSKLSKMQIENIFHQDKYLRFVDEIFSKVFH